MSGGRGLDAIAGYSVTGAYYSAAVTTLKSRFGRPKLIAEKHILELVQMERCTQPTVTKLRRLNDRMSSNVRALVALNKDLTNETLSAAEVLLAVLKQKLPTIIRKRWESKALEGNPEEITLEAFLEFLQTLGLSCETRSVIIR
uniref:Uncharacterized protein n=1 Tax=Trichuris muris TaxID=70415 RepID=A0A5S6Q7W5_TRIMR